MTNQQVRPLNRLRHWFWRLSWLRKIFWVFGPGIATVVLTAVLAVRLGGSQSSAPPATCTIKSKPATVLTAENDFRHGVWTFASPKSFPGFSDQSTTPTGGASWLPNCTLVTVTCVTPGGGYSFKNTLNGQLVSMRWRLWAHLAGGDWLPLASVGETAGMRQPRLSITRC